MTRWADGGPLRILLSIHHPLDRDSGAAGVVMRIAEEYRRGGHEARILSHDDLPRWITGRARDLAFPALLAAEAGRWRPDVIDASSGDGCIAFSRPIPGGALRVTHSHGLEHLSSTREQAEEAQAGRRPSLSKRLWRHGLRLRLVARSFRCADLALVLNDAEAAHLGRVLGVAPGSIRRMRLGTDHAGLRIEAPARQPGGIVQIGAYAPRKGVAVTAGAMIRAMMQRPDITLSFIGTGVPRDGVLADYPAALHPRIAVVERYANAALPGLLASRSICLMPSLFEGYGLAKLEAMACGLAVIASDDEGARTDIVHGVTGQIVPRGDDRALAAMVIALVDHPERAEALGRTGMAMASRFSWGVVARERIDAYREYAARGRQSS